MSITHEPHVAPDVASVLPGREVVARLRRVLIVSLAAALIYPAFMRASAGYCAGGFDGADGFVDAAGRPVDEAPTCIQLSLGPSPLVYFGIALIVLFAIDRVLKAADEPAALRILDRAAAGVVVLVLGAVVISQVWFHLIPIDEFMSGSFSFLSPFPFGFIESSTSPVTAP
ncbi:hypothetical protein [Microbacterium sulfonylureivorans]|uniref:hypothetical protein n=1 Tax=Microbacterium sulfonylureivorans TaxID=2486854 RepID=UPI001F0C91D8|nr:hypothetical protein [Microbacterium sulfonylureivorans]